MNLKIMSINILFTSVALLSGCGLPCNENLPLVPRLQCENFGIPSISSAMNFSEPRIESRYEVCNVKQLTLNTEEERFDCAEETFWHGFSDGRLSARQSAVEILSNVINLNADSDNLENLARLYNLRSDLRMAMALENGQNQYIIFADRFIRDDLRKALEINPGYEPAQAFLDTMDVALAIISNNWSKAISFAEASLDRIELLADSDPHLFTGATFSVSGTYQGFPLATGIPQRTVQLTELAGCPETLYWCVQNTEHAPYALPGVAYHFAEMHARVGDREKTQHYLNKATQADGYNQWAFKYYVEDALADIDQFLAKWAEFGDYKTPLLEGYANKNVGCSFCHSRQ